MYSVRKPLLVILVALGGAYVFWALNGPRGIPALHAKREEISRLQQENADLVRDLQAKQARIHRLEKNKAEQELEIRKRLKMLRPGETTFIVPEKPESSK